MLQKWIEWPHTYLEKIVAEGINLSRHFIETIHITIKTPTVDEWQHISKGNKMNWKKYTTVIIWLCVVEGTNFRAKQYCVDKRQQY